MNIYQLHDARRALREALNIVEEAIQDEHVRMLNNGEATIVDGALIYAPDESMAELGEAGELGGKP